MEETKLNLGIESLSDIANRYQVKAKKPKKRVVYSFQELGAEILKKIPDAHTKQSSLFQLCKQDERTMKIAFSDCMELDKPHIDYLFKVYHALRANYK